MAELGRTCIVGPSEGMLHLQSKWLYSLGQLRYTEYEGEGSLPGFAAVLAFSEKGFVCSSMKPQIKKKVAENCPLLICSTLLIKNCRFQARQ